MKKGTMSDVIIIGGGLAGLTAAARLGQHGRSVRLLEKGQTTGGRAVTQNRNGFQLNLGPHALYANGAGSKVLAELGVPVSGHVADFGHKTLAADAGNTYLLPQTPGTLLRT